MRLKNTKNIVVSLLISIIMISSVITLSSETLNFNNEEEFGDIIATSYYQNPLGEVTKKIWNKDSSSWVDTINAEIGETITFNISVKYVPLYTESLVLYNITVNDTLPNSLEYSNNAILCYDDAEIPGESWISGKTIFWNLSEDPYSVYLWNLSKPGTEAYVDNFYILYNATVIECTDVDGEQNNVKVEGWETCPKHWVYGEDTATIIVDCTPPCNGDLTIEKYVKWDCTLPFKKSIDADIGDYVTFKLYVNTSEEIMDISVRDELPDGLSYITDSSEITGITVADDEPEIDTANNYLYWNFTDVPADSHIIITFEANVDECGIHINIANVTGEVECDIKYYDEDQATVNVECPTGEEDITIEKYVKWACDPNYEKYVEGVINDWVTFKLYVNNTGDIPLDISVRDELPDGLSYITDSSEITGITVADDEPEIDTANNYLYWNFTDVPADTHIIITFRAEIDECGELINIANVTGEYDSTKIYDVDSSTVNVDCPSPETLLEKKVWNKTSMSWEENIIAYIGDTVRFNITISYTGENILYNINITDELPSGLEYANNANPVESGISGNTIYWNLTEDYDVHLNDGEKYYIEFDAIVIGEGEQINIADLVANECSGIIIEDEDNAIVNVDTTYGLICEKSVRAHDGTWVNEINANVGDTIRFNISVTYVGSVFIYSIWVNDTLPACLEYANSAIPKEPTIDGNKLLWHFQDDYLDPGESIYIEFNANVVSEGTCVNTINVKACECNECTELICTDTAIINVFSELEADASGSPIQIYEGETVTFSGSATGGTPPYTWSWDFDDGTSSSQQNPTHQFNNQGQYNVILTVTDDNDNTDTDMIIITVNEEDTNTKPNKPSRPTGQTNGDKETEYSYSTSATDPDGDQIFYLWDWGDGTNSGWLGPNNSGATVTASHSWSEGSYEIKVRVKDTEGLLSDWSDPLAISMPKYKFVNNIFLRILEILMERMPLLEKILNLIFVNI